MSKKSKKTLNKIMIRKKSNSFEEFSEKKYRQSLIRAGVSKIHTDQIVEQIQQRMKDYFSTSLLHNATYKAILKISKVHAANYNIKRAIYNLGPTGYPFEILCAEMFKAKGFKTRVSVTKKGKFVKHEVDVVARRDDINIFCECKFHNHKFHKNDIKIPLYVHSRYLDIKEGNPYDTFKYALITNTLFSEDAIKYAEGVGLLLYSMNYPKKNTFIDLIRRYKVYPITALKSLRVRDRKKLLESKIVVIKQIKRASLEELDLTELQITKVLQEIKILTRPN